MKDVKVAIVGFGGIARAHYTGYKILAGEGAPIRLVAVCDIDAAKFDSPVKINIGGEEEKLAEHIHRYTDIDQMLANEEFDMADICLPSYLHKDYTVKMLNAGKHVLCEKPMALSGEQCEEMIASAKANGKKLMIGQCLRFIESYLFLKKCVDEGTYGKMKNIFMDRRSPQPRWGFEHWFERTDKCGGCILDMHIHDVDMARFLLGEPYAVSVISTDGDVRWQVENTRLYYKDTMVVINGSWGESPSTSFYAGFRARFERATVTSENGVTVYPDDGKSFSPELPNTNHMAEEIRFFASTILGETVNEKNTPESACATVKLIEKLRESADANGAIVEV